MPPPNPPSAEGHDRSPRSPGPQSEGAPVPSHDTGLEVTVVDGREAAPSHKYADTLIAVRDPRKPEGPTLFFTPAEWKAFIAGVKDGEFDLPEDED
ncbi:MAG: DUF397 domain-containing protein [Carbonactinosporaceae bacterium]